MRTTGGLASAANLAEVKILLLCPPQGVLRAHDAHLLTGVVDETNLGNADALVDAGGISLRRLPVKPTRDRHLARVCAQRQERGAVWERVINATKYRRVFTAGSRSDRRVRIRGCNRRHGRRW